MAVVGIARVVEEMVKLVVGNRPGGGGGNRPGGGGNRPGGGGISQAGGGNRPGGGGGNRPGEATVQAVAIVPVAEAGPILQVTITAVTDTIMDTGAGEAEVGAGTDVGVAATAVGDTAVEDTMSMEFGTPHMSVPPMSMVDMLTTVT